MTAPLEPFRSSVPRSRKLRRRAWPPILAVVICASFAALSLLFIGNAGWNGHVALGSLLLIACIGALSAGVYAVSAFIIALLNALLGKPERDR